MCDCFGDNRTIEVHRQPTKRYQFIRPSSKPKRLPTPTVIHHPAPEKRPVQDTFEPQEGEDLPVTLHNGGGRTSNFHPLPPVVHQPSLPQSHLYHPQQRFAALPASVQHHPHHLSYPSATSSLSDTGTLILDAPGHNISRIPNRVLRNHSSSSRGSLHHHRRSGAGKYKYYYPSSTSGSSGSRSSGRDSWADEWDQGTLKSEWSDGGDSWDEWEGGQGKRLIGAAGAGRRIEWNGGGGGGGKRERGAIYLK